MSLLWPNVYKSFFIPKLRVCLWLKPLLKRRNLHQNPNPSQRLSLHRVYHQGILFYSYSFILIDSPGNVSTTSSQNLAQTPPAISSTLTQPNSTAAPTSATGGPGAPTGGTLSSMPQLQAAPVREQKTRPNRPKRPHRPDDGTGEQSKRTKSDSKKREIKGCRSVLKVLTFL